MYITGAAAQFVNDSARQTSAIWSKVKSYEGQHALDELVAHTS
jgi:hypothetical protein